MFISKEIFDWGLRSEDSSIYYGWEKPYEYWNHAEELLINVKNQYTLIDSISSLKRAVDFRVKDLNSRYNLKTANPKLKKKNNFERLANFGIIKPIMLEKLLAIRNGIEHKFENPPTVKICQELSEFVWYFLRSTDSYCSEIVKEFIFERDLYDESYWPSGNVNLKNWEFKLRGWIEESLISIEPKKNYYCIDCQLETFTEFKERIKNFNENDPHFNRKETDISIGNGYIKDDELQNILIEKYFKMTLPNIHYHP